MVSGKDLPGWANSGSNSSSNQVFFRYLGFILCDNVMLRLCRFYIFINACFLIKSLTLCECIVFLHGSMD